MARKESIAALIDPEYKIMLQKRCLDYNTTISAVIRDAMKKFMESHPPLREGYREI